MHPSKRCDAINEKEVYQFPIYQATCEFTASKLFDFIVAMQNTLTLILDNCWERTELTSLNFVCKPRWNTSYETPYNELFNNPPDFAKPEQTINRPLETQKSLSPVHNNRIIIILRTVRPQIRTLDKKTNTHVHFQITGNATVAI